MNCNKVPYLSKKAALTARNKRLKKGPRRNRPHYLRVYPCDICEGGVWHLTHLQRYTQDDDQEE